MDLSPRDGPLLSDSELVQDVVSGIVISQYCQIAVIALLVYDCMITQDREGASLKKPVTVIYYMNRYVSIFGSIARFFGHSTHETTPICRFSLWSNNLTTAVVIISVDCILTIRVLAFYTPYRQFSRYLVILLTLESAAKVVSAVYGTWVQHAGSLTIAKGVTVCKIPTFSPALISFAISDWSLPMSFGLVLMCLSLCKAAEYWKESAGFKGFRLVKVLIRDQVIYFAALIIFCALNITWYKLLALGADSFVLRIVQELGRPAYLSILGSRMLFNLKEAGKRGFNEGTNYWPKKSLGNIEFCEPDAALESKDAGGSGSATAQRPV